MKQMPLVRAPQMALSAAAALLLAAVVTACGSSSAPATASAGSAAAAIAYAPTPDADPFYAQPNPMPNVPPGTILNSRSVTFAPLGVPQPNPAWQLQYMSKDLHGGPQAQIATVVKSLLPALSQPQPLVSFQFAEDAPGLKCAPSHAVTGSTADQLSTGEGSLLLSLVQTSGWTMVIPDHEGPLGVPVVGGISGPIILDGIRAAEKFAPLGLSGAATPVGLWGYSGGSVATVGALVRQASYAPELNIVGSVNGGTPADWRLTLPAFENTGTFSIAFGGIVAVNRVYPELLSNGLLNAKGIATAEAVKDGCPLDLTVPIGARLTDYTTVPDPYTSSGAEALYARINLPHPGEVPTQHVFVYDAILDELAPISATDVMVKAWCDAGAHISYYRDAAGGEHLAGEAAMAPYGYAYLQSVFTGATPVLPPGTTTCN
jgi:triacylglycerol lipase